ncbi:MAG TPA: tetratricopeptide repeat protein [Methylophilus sp.]|nr:tetratricopeptide repeat protein [Methylophilus sp.]HQQ32902.1 tetratricopeptide repeat protein [Methylophilus sp.]
MNNALPNIKKVAVYIATMLACNAIPAYAEHAKAPASGSVKPEYIYQYLLGEVAGQRGDPILSSRLFLDLAKKTRDPRVAERAARAAVFAQQPGIALQAVKLWAELSPDSTEAHQAASQLLVSSGNLKEAKPHIKKLLAKEDTRAHGFLYLTSLLSQQKDKGEVFDTVKELAKPYPKLPEAYFAIAQSAWLAEDSEAAKKALDTADKLRPGWEVAAQMQGQILQKNSPDKAITYYQQFLAKYPKANEVRLSYAKLLVSHKRYTEAKPEFVKLVEVSDGNPDISAVAGLLALESNETSMADKYLQMALDKGFKDSEQLYIYLGRSAEKQKNDQQALNWYDKVIVGNHYLEGRLSAANVISRTKGVDAAITMLDEVDNLTTEQQVTVIQAEASLLTQAKRDKEAYELLQKAVANMPDTAELIYDYAMAAERTGQLSVMESELYRLIKLKPDYASAYNALGYSFADRGIKLQEAKNLIETALKLQPGDHYILDSLGWVHYRLGNFNDAAKYLREAYNIQADPEIAAHLGEVLWKLGQQEEARKIWANALEANPNNEVLIATSNRFKS